MKRLVLGLALGIGVTLIAVGATVGTGVPMIDETAADAVDAISTEPEDIDTAAVAAAVHERVNELRQQRGYRPLDRVSRLDSIAATHAQEMAAATRLSHDLNGQSMSDRYRAAGISCPARAENIAYTYADQDLNTDSGGTVDHSANETSIGHGVVRQWLNSPPHRENLFSDASAEGVGVSVTKSNGSVLVYVTQNLC
jgi:uncharacterized protein YkwD